MPCDVAACPYRIEPRRLNGKPAGVSALPSTEVAGWRLVLLCLTALPAVLRGIGITTQGPVQRITRTTSNVPSG